MISDLDRSLGSRYFLNVANETFYIVRDYSEGTRTVKA